MHTAQCTFDRCCMARTSGTELKLAIYLIWSLTSKVVHLSIASHLVLRCLEPVWISQNLLLWLWITFVLAPDRRIRKSMTGLWTPILFLFQVTKIHCGDKFNDRYSVYLSALFQFLFSTLSLRIWHYSWVPASQRVTKSIQQWFPTFLWLRPNFQFKNIL